MTKISTERKKGRGAQKNPHNRFLKNSIEIDPNFQEHCRLDEEKIESSKTSYLEIFPKRIITRVNSQDVPFNFSLNPYQGCEHGCVYCYARNTHEFYGYSAGTDFEKKILVKKSAPTLLIKELNHKNWTPALIMLSGNTDCYQPIERKLKITRSILEIFEKMQHPVGIITKNSLIQRDLDLLESLNNKNLLRITLSITSLNEDLRRLLEPRTASVHQKLKTVKLLSEKGIKVNINMAPVIPGINSHEILELAKVVAENGAHSLSYTVVRLNGQIGDVFEDWARKTFPFKAEKVLNQIKEMHQGKLNDSRWGTRMKGEGNYALQIKDLFRIARQKYFKNPFYPDLDYSLFRKSNESQLKLF